MTEEVQELPRKFYRNPENGDVYEYARDGSQDEYIPESYIRLTPEEAEEHLRPKVDENAREQLWRAAEIVVVKDNLEAILFEDPDALPGTDAEWKAYGVALRKWVEGASGYPAIESRPARPTA